MTEEQKKQIRRLRNAGMGYKRISAALDIPFGTIKSFCRRDETDTYASGRRKRRRFLRAGGAGNAPTKP